MPKTLTYKDSIRYTFGLDDVLEKNERSKETTTDERCFKNVNIGGQNSKTTGFMGKIKIAGIVVYYLILYNIRSTYDLQQVKQLFQSDF